MEAVCLQKVLGYVEALPLQTQTHEWLRATDLSLWDKYICVLHNKKKHICLNNELKKLKGKNYELIKITRLGSPAHSSG